jgi:hypothetical protein
MSAARSARSFLLALLLAAALPAPAARAARDVSVGLKAGISAANWHGEIPIDDLIQRHTRYAFSGGIAVHLGLDRTFAFQPELLYVQKGTSLGDIELTDPFGTPTGTAHVVLAANYLELPLLLRVALPGVGHTAPYLIAGPTLGMRGAQRQIVTGDIKASQAIHFVKETDVGAAFGVGAEVGSGKGRFNIESRYTLGLTDATQPEFSDNARNGALLVMVGVALHP